MSSLGFSNSSSNIKWNIDGNLLVINSAYYANERNNSETITIVRFNNISHIHFSKPHFYEGIKKDGYISVHSTANYSIPFRSENMSKAEEFFELLITKINIAV